MQDESGLSRAVAMVADLRARCDWDRIQTRETLRPYLIEEAHELAAALASGDPAAIRDEVADLMLHLAWQLVLGLETGEFTPDQVADDLVAKMRRRHPHLFDLGPQEQWESLKAREGKTGRGTLDGLPATLPDLLMAYRLQERAAASASTGPTRVDRSPRCAKNSPRSNTNWRARRAGENAAAAPTKSATCSSRWSISPGRWGCSPARRSTAPTGSSGKRFEQVERLARSAGSRWRRRGPGGAGCAVG